MKAIKHFTILLLALCCSYFANAQCPTAFSYSVTGNNVTLTSTNGFGSEYLFAWYLDGSHIAGPGLDTSYTFQNVPAGSHHVCYYATQANNGNFCDSVCQTIGVTSCGTLNAQWTSAVGLNDTVRFVAYDTNSTAHHIWNFGDGTSTSGTSVTHVYSASGTYHVCFYSYIPGSACSDSLCESVVVPANTSCPSSFTDTVHGTTVNVHVNGTWSGYTFAWYLDGSLVLAANPNTSYQYQNVTPGAHRLCLYSYNNTHFCDSVCQSVTITSCGAMTAAWEVWSLTQYAARFYAYDNTPNATHNWAFGDGTTGTGNAIVHTYPHPGAYSVCLYVNLPGTVCADTLCEQISINSDTGGCGVGSFTYHIIGDTAIAATNTSVSLTSPFNGFQWVLYNSNLTYLQGGTDSSIVTSGLAPGTYYLELFLSTSHAYYCDSVTNVITIPAVTHCGTASFAAYILNDSTIRGYSTSTGTNDSTTYVWNVYSSNGNLVQSTSTAHTPYFLSNPVAIGTYRVCLSLYSSINAQVLCSTACDTINVLRCSSLTAAWQTNGNTAGSDTVHFYNSTNPTGTVYAWTFGDGSTSSASNPTHVYTQSGLYTICLVVSNPAVHCKDTLCQNITVGNPNACGVAAFSYYYYNDSTLRVYSTSTGTSDSSSYVWTVSGIVSGIPFTETIPTHHVNNFSSGTLAVGTYTVCLKLYNAQGTYCDSTCHNIQVLRCSSLNNTWHYTTSATSDTAKFTIPTNDPTGSTFVWTFGDGTSSTNSPSVTHVYSSPGTYTVCLIASNPAVTCHDTLCQSVVVGSNNVCPASFTDSVTANNVSVHVLGTWSGYTFAWYLDGTMVQAANPNTSYQYQNVTPGTHRLCMYSYNNNTHFCDSVCETVTVTSCGTLTAQWTNHAITSDTVIFFAYDTNSLAHHIWNFGDGTSGTGTSLTHIYSAPGTYHVCFYAYIPGSVCSDSLCETIVVPGQTTVCPVAAFSDYIYGDSSIHIYSTSTGVTSTTYYGYTVRNANGALVYTNYGTALTFATTPALPAGSYTVCLTVAISANNHACDTACTDHVVIPIVGACGTAAFKDTVYPGLGGGAIHAYTTSVNVDSMSQYSWKIWGPHGNLVQTFTGGDFTSSTLDTGTYTVCQYIRATGSTYICDSLCQTVVVGGGTNPCAGMTAAWTYTLQSNTSDSVEFHGPNEPSGSYYYWSFGDGAHASAQSVLHGYAQAGTYTVCLIAYRSGCSDTSCQSVVITTTAPCPVAAFSQYVYGDTSIHAYSQTTGATANTSYYWTVATTNGIQVATGSSHGTSASFISPALPNGTYNVCLYVAAVPGANFCNYVCHSIVINDTVHPCSGLNANFTETSLQNGNAQFTASDTGSGVVHYWHFGDGSVLSTTSVTSIHAYNAAGTYHVCQYVFYDGNTTCLDSFCTNITVHASGCNASFNYHDYYPPYNGVQFTSTSTSTDSIISYTWSFGDNTSGSFKTGDHVYPHSGNWYACLTIATHNGCTSTHCDTVNVQYNACAGLSANYTYTYAQSGGVHFAGSTAIANVTNYWTFGDGTTAATFDPVHYYTQPGTYTVCHIVSIPGTLCSDTSCQSVQGTNTGTGCVANFTDSASANNNMTVIFTNTSTSTDSIVSYAWTFGDGASSSDKNVHHLYSTPGSYRVCLTITSANGCTNTYCDSVHPGTHSEPGCHASFTYTVDSCQVITFTSTSTGSLSFLRWIYGDGTTDTTYHPTHHYAQGGNYTVILHFYGANCYNFDTAVISVPSCNAPGDTVCGFVFDDLNGNGVQNTGEPGIPNAEVHVGSYVVHADSTGHYVVVVPAGAYTIYYCAPAGYSFTIPVHTPLDSANTSTCAAYQHIQVTGGQNCGYNFGILTNTVTICGAVYFDANDDHSQDNNESGIPNARVVFTQNGHVVYTGYTDQYGHYCAVLPVGTYSITAASSTYPNGVVYPGSITVAATTPGGSYDNNNFGIYVQPTGCDLDIQITPSTQVTPGYPAWYQIEVCNVGTSVTSGTVNLFYDPTLTYNYSSPAATSQNSTTFTATWNLAGLNPGSCQYYYVSLTADTTLTSGHFIFTMANVTTDGCTDIHPDNNVDTLHQNVTSSWDPNNKQVSPAGEGPDGFVNYNQWLTYTINFQNTGTAPAINIVVEDTLSQYLDVAKFKMLGASLPYTMQFSGNVVIWKFNAVSLPDSSTDQQGSHGFVSFMVPPVQNVATKTVITNQADIYFDYNAPVATNRTLNTIDYSLSVNNIAASDVTITLQPNPFGQYTTIKVDGAEGPYQLSVYDMLGRMVKTQNAAGNVFTIDRGSLSSGMYTYELMHNGTVIGKGKMIAQ